MPVTRKNNIPDIRKLSEKLKRQLPLVIANKAKNHYLEGFRRGGGMTDKSRGGWQARKKADRQRGNRAILVKTGHLRGDLDVRRVSVTEIVLGTLDTSYGIYHNEGMDPQPLREFLGKSRALDAKIDTLIKKKMKETYG